MIKDDILYEFCKDHYYCDPDPEDGTRWKWEPFEYYSDDQIEEYIENDVDALKLLLKTHINKEWDSIKN